MLRRLRPVLLACLLLPWLAAAQPPAAGTLISNTATATFVDATTGLSVHLNSNTVSTKVAPLEALTLTASQNLLLATGSPFTISHVLTNTGNVATTYAISAVDPSGTDSFSPQNLQVVEDSNGDGKAEAGEPVIATGGTLTLNPGQIVDLLLTGQVPSTALAGQTAQLVLTATSTGQSASASNTDTINLTNGPAVLATLTASTPTATPGAVIGLTATAVNNGSVAANAVPVSVNGGTQTLFVLSLPVPANTQLSSVQPSTNVGAQVLYHVAGSPANTYVTTQPAAATVDAVAWSLSTLPNGGSLQGQVTVTANANASGNITDVAAVAWTSSAGGGAMNTPSNVVAVNVPVQAPSIAYYTDSTYTATTGSGAPGNPLYVQVSAGVCNSDPTQVLTIPITLTSKLTGDVETFTGIETAPNTGLFRIQPSVPTANAATHVVASGDGILEVLANDIVTATITSCGGVSASASTTLLVDPNGVVYDSHTNQNVTGAKVQLIDVTGAGNGGNPGGPARVFQPDGVTAAPSSVTTGTDGSFVFALVPPSTYEFVVTTPAGYAFPSRLPPALQPAGRNVDPQASYGQPFVISTSTLAPVHDDIPLDESSANGSLFVNKTADKSSASIGDFVDYSVQVNNQTAVNIADVVVTDTLPAGFSYVKGSARLGAAVLADPSGNWPVQHFNLGALAGGAQDTLTYRVLIGVGSQNSNGINTAQAQGAIFTSNLSSAQVQVTQGVFSPNAYIIGKVFADCKRSRIDEPGDSGIPGVRVYLEDGTSALTDEEGKYSFYGLIPRTHVAKVDATTLPDGARLEVLDNRNAFDPNSRFVDLTNGELAKADFAVDGCSDDLKTEIARRRKEITAPSEISQAANNLLQATAVGSVDPHALPASGTLGLPGSNANGGGATAATPAAPGAAGGIGGIGVPGAGSTVVQQPAAAQPAAPKPAGTLAELLPTLTPEVGFVGLEAGQVLDSTQTRVRVKGPLGATLQLFVNGKPVGDKQVGSKSVLESHKIEAWEYIGVQLLAGKNQLEVKATDPFGGLRGSASIEVLAPGPLAKIEVDAPTQAAATSEADLVVHVRLLDAAGLPVTSRTLLTLNASLGNWKLAPGAGPTPDSTFVEGGRADLLLTPPDQPGKGELLVESGSVQTRLPITFNPKLRPMIAAGIVDAQVNLRNLQSAQNTDVFAQEIQSVSRSFDDGKGDVGAHTAFFLKGKVLGSSLLTLAYDSDKPSDTTLLRNIEPDQYYPVYGDSSVKTFDAQSTGKLYVMLQHGTSYALIGDFTTQSDDPARQLTQYTRALNGVKAHWDGTRGSVEGFASRTTSTQEVQEFAANGTSGPFQLNLNGIANSETVQILIVDRNQPSVVLSSTTLTAFTDYAIEPYTGLLQLKVPVPTVDANLNPEYIRVTYSVDNGGPEHFVGGASGKFAVTPGLTLGAVAIKDEDPAAPLQIEGVTATAKLGEQTTAIAEVAQTDGLPATGGANVVAGVGRGERVDVTHNGDKLQLHAWDVQTDAGFNNPSSTQNAGAGEAGIKAGYTLDATDRVAVEGLRTTNSSTGAAQSGLELKLEHSLPGNAKFEIGVRHSVTNAEAALSEPVAPGAIVPAAPLVAASGAAVQGVGYTSIKLKLDVPVPHVEKADAYASGEYAMDGAGGKEIAVGANYQVNASTKIYAVHDLSDSLAGPYSLDPSVEQYTTVVGLSTNTSDATQVFNEYRVGDGLDGPAAEDAIGLKHTWRIADGVGVTGSLQRIKPVSGNVTDQSDAATIGFTDTASANLKWSDQLQWQISQASRSWLYTAALADKLSRSWTWLNRVMYNDQLDGGSAGGSRKLATLQTGAAFRPVDTDRWNALGQIEYKRDQDSTLGAGLDIDQAAWIAAANLNMQPRAGEVITSRYAIERQNDFSLGLDSESLLQLLGARATVDLNDHWDAGLQGWSMWGNGSRENAVGLEAGYLVYRNLWLSMGYNFDGFDASDLSGEAYTQRGVYMNLRFKFDENAVLDTPKLR